MQDLNVSNIFATSPDFPAVEPTRRGFLKLGAGTGAGLILGLAALPASGISEAIAAETESALAPNPFLIVSPDNSVTVIIKHLDKGQGAATGLATLVAEELDAAHDQVRTEFAPADVDKYKNLAFGVQGVGGSTGLANSYEQYRKAGATAREMLVAAAAEMWSVPVSDITVKAGKLTATSGKSATFGELANKAAQQSVPSEPKLKEPKEFVYIGKDFARVDSPAKVRGEARFTIDYQFDDMLIATIVRPPKFGAKLKSFDASSVSGIKGIVKLLEVPQGVAILATSTWPALKAQRAIKVEWSDDGAEARGTPEIIAAYRQKLDKPGLKARSEGDVEAGFENTAKIIEVDYEFPYLAHAPMEPMDCVIRYDGSKADIWTGSQLQTVDHGAACKVLSLKPEAVNLHTVWAGGSFGRRAIADSHYVREACEIAKAFGKDVPIKVMWTREDDIRGGWYRPIYVHRVKAGLDQDGKIVAWQHRIVGQSIITGTPFESNMVKDGIDQTSVEGASNLPYAIPNLSIELHTEKVGVPVLWWRSVGSTHTAHAVEHTIDILAKETGKDPVEYRLAMLKEHPRHVGVLKLAAEKAGWGEKLPDNIHRGIAVHESFSSYVANVADCEIQDDGTIKVKKVTCAIDCGVAVNPDVVKAQMEGGLGYGLGAALKGAVTMTNGKVDQNNFDGYDVLRMFEMPDVEVHIVESSEKPTGVGEPGTPVILPAAANAMLWATGVRTTVLPMNKQSFKSGA